MSARRSPLAVLLHVLAVLAVCAAARIDPSSFGPQGARGPAVTATRGGPSTTTALRSLRDAPEARIARRADARAGLDLGLVARLPEEIVTIAPPPVIRLGVERPIAVRVVVPSTRVPTARGPPALV